MPNAPLYYAPVKEFHHPILSTLAMHVGQVKREIKRPVSSALEAEDMENLIICEIVRNCPFMLGTGMLSYSMMCAPAWL